MSQGPLVNSGRVVYLRVPCNLTIMAK